MDNVGRRYPHGVERHRGERIAGTMPVAMVGDALARRVEFDAGPNTGTHADLAVQVGWHHEVDHERWQAVARIGDTKVGEGLAALDHCPLRQRLQTIEVGEARAMRPVGPSTPKRMQRVAHRSVRGHRAGLDAGADRVRH